MIKEIKELLSKYKDFSIFDLTYGAGGHSELFLSLTDQVKALDRDKQAQKYKNNQIPLYEDTFSNIDKYSQGEDFFFGDLGMSTMQLESDRGFSYQKDGDLSMNMGFGKDLKYVLKYMNYPELVSIIKTYGEEKKAKIISKNIIKYREKKYIKTSLQLREAIKIDDFKLLSRVFQAFRIYVNQELEEINILCNKLPKLTKKGVLFLTFHSLEDRLIKNFTKKFPINGFILPSEEEIEKNPKARSVKLRYGLIE